MKNYPHLSESIAEVIETIRKERGLSKSSLADFADMQRCYLLEILGGKKKPTLNAIFCICEALQIQPTDFIALVVQRIEAKK